CREGLGVQSGQVVVLTPGRLAPEKGLEDLLEAAACLRNFWGSRLVFWIAGDGPLRSQLNEIVERYDLSAMVRFLGFRDDVPLLLQASDVVVLPTWREGLSIALLEAMASGKAIVTTNISPNVEATQSGKAASLVSPGRPHELGEAIGRLADSRSL